MTPAIAKFCGALIAAMILLLPITSSAVEIDPKAVVFQLRIK